MKFALIQDRQTGKTTEVINYAYRNEDAVIVVSDMSRMKAVVAGLCAKGVSAEVALTKVLTMSMLTEGKTRGYYGSREYIFDEVSDCLTYLLPGNSTVIGITGSVEKWI